MKLSFSILFASIVLVDAVSIAKRDNVNNEETTAVATTLNGNINKLLKSTLHSRQVWDRLNEMTSKFGSRLTGSVGLAKSTDWIVDKMKNDDGLNVRLEEVKVNHWHRGRESLVQLNEDGSERKIPMTTLGRSAASPKQGVEAEIVVVRTFDELKRLGEDKIRGKIVVYNEAWAGYGGTVSYRTRGAQEAAKYGAVGAVIASITPEASADNLHTGFSITASIPAAAITRRDARRFEQEYKQAIEHPNQHKVPRLRLFTESYLDPEPKIAYNIVAEVRGREQPDKIIVLGGHIDSWDIGVGAVDDGAGAFTCWEALRAISKLSRPPKRTIRLVMWVDEEQGGAGGDSYAERHAQEIDNHVLAIETDYGNFEPAGLLFSGSKPATDILRSIGTQYHSSKVGQFAGNIVPTSGSPGADITPLCKKGVPCAGLISRDPITGEAADTNYGYLIHDDKMSFLKPEQLAKNAAALAIWTYTVAEQDAELPRA
ncbi:hypothetical protein BDF22DRAFT_669140 [Syncephalis plumigaleata]|nr:hypothetical protein BDF22DRAFT_669140 [Syncephalis plumigaleata]